MTSDIRFLVSETCNHHRSYKFFVESIKTLTCATEINFEENKEYQINLTSKRKPKIVCFGEHISLRAAGVYYFRTNPNNPYLISK